MLLPLAGGVAALNAFDSRQIGPLWGLVDVPLLCLEGSSLGMGTCPRMLECVRALLQAGADPHLQRGEGRSSDESLVQWLVRYSLRGQGEACSRLSKDRP